MRAYRMRIKSDPIKHQKYLERERMRNKRRSEKRKQAKQMKRALLNQQRGCEAAESSSDTSGSKCRTTITKPSKPASSVRATDFAGQYSIDDLFSDLEKIAYSGRTILPQPKHKDYRPAAKPATPFDDRSALRCVPQATLLKPPEQLSQEDYEKVLRNIPVKLTSSVTIQICDKPPEADNLPLRQIMPQERDTITVRVYNKDASIPIVGHSWTTSSTAAAVAVATPTIFPGQCEWQSDCLPFANHNNSMAPVDVDAVFGSNQCRSMMQHSRSGSSGFDVNLSKSNSHQYAKRKSSKNRRYDGSVKPNGLTSMIDSDFVDSYMNYVDQEMGQINRDKYPMMVTDIFAQLSK